MTIEIKPSHLKYKYSNEAVNGDSPKFTGKPDNVLFNKQEGYEVIPMIEALLKKLGFQRMGFKTHVATQLLEELIQKDLPSDIRKREDVYDWLLIAYRRGV